MMQGLRAKTKALMWFVVVAFVGSIGLIWGADVLGPSGGRRKSDPANIGTVNGERIPAAYLQRAVERAYAEYETQYGRRPSEEEEFIQISEEAWNNVVTEVLLAQEIRKRKIEVVDEEILLHVKGSPPPELQQAEIFQTDGRFDYNKYLQAVETLDPRINWVALEYEIRSLLPRVKLEQQITASARVTNQEIREAFARQNEKVKVSYAFFGPGDFADEEVPSSESELRDYYESHAEDYRLPDQAVLRYVTWPKEPSPEDEAIVVEQMEEIRQEIVDGADFAEMAEIYTDDSGSAENGGDLGLFGPGDMVGPFEEAAYALQIGEISELVKTDYGYHIIRLEEKKGEQIRARHILLELKPSRRTLDDLWVQASQFDSLAEASGFVESAKEVGLEVLDTTPFPQGTYVPGIGRSTRANLLAFEEEVGAVIGPFNTSGAFVMCQIVSREPTHIRPFEDVSDQVLAHFETLKRREMARAEAERVASEISEGKTLEQAAPANSLRHAGPFSETTASGGITGDPSFVGTAFVLPEDRTSGLVETRTGYVILRVDERLPLNEEELLDQKDMLRRQLHMRKQQAVFSYWFNQVYETADIQDYRDQLRGS